MKDVLKCVIIWLSDALKILKFKGPPNMYGRS